MICRLQLKAVYPSAKAAMAALLKELDRLSRIQLNPAKVPGSVLIDFDDDWPATWIWQDEPGWIDQVDLDLGEEGVTLRADRQYDIRGYHLVPEDGGGGSQPLVGFVRDFIRKGLV